MKIKVEYIDTYAVKVMTFCRYHMADGTISYYAQTGKGMLK